MISARRAGNALIGFGAAGLVLVAVAALLLLVTIDQIEGLAGGVGRERDRVVALLEPASAALDRAATSAENAGTSLAGTAVAARDAAALTTQLAGAFDQLASLGELQVLGTRPFAAAAGSFADTAARSRSLSAQLFTAADSMFANVTDSAAVAQDLRGLAAQLDEIERSVGAASEAPANAMAFVAFRVVLLALLAWLGIAAGGLAWLGVRMRGRAHDA